MAISQKLTFDFLSRQNELIFTIITIKISLYRYIGDHTYLFLRRRSTASQTAITAMAVKTMTHLAAPPVVVMAITAAVVPLRRRSRAQMKALDLIYPSAAHPHVGSPLWESFG